MKPLLYLCGPIRGLSFEEAKGWRRQLGERLRDYYTILDPLRDVFSFVAGSELARDIHDRLVDTTNVFRRDLYDVHRCDVLLCNLEGAKRVSIFSVMELGWAFQAGKFTITVLPDDNCHEHFCVRQASSLVVPCLSRAESYLSSQLGASHG